MMHSTPDAILKMAPLSCAVGRSIYAINFDSFVVVRGQRKEERVTDAQTLKWRPFRAHTAPQISKKERPNDSSTFSARPVW